MPKLQKNLQLPESVVKWMEQAELDSGRSQARIVVAALAQWLMSEEATHSFFMRIGGMVEAEQLGFEDLRQRMADWEIESWESALRAIERSKSLVGSDVHGQAILALKLAKEHASRIKERR